MTSSQMRESLLFLRNSFPVVGRFELPFIEGIEPFNNSINLISWADTRSKDKGDNLKRGVHFFVDDYRFEGIYNHPESSLKKLQQYAFVLTPDYSLYADMPLWRQLENVAKNRWLGAYWQSKGMHVIPSISWSTPKCFQFCFDGVAKESVVSVSMIGCKRSKENFLKGYTAMLNKLNPKQIIVFGTPFDEMKGNILSVDYIDSRRSIR